MIESLIKKGYSIMPLNPDKSPKLKTWAYLQKEKLTDLSLFTDNNIGLICGKISGNILVIDVDC